MSMVYSVSQLNGEIRQLLEQGFRQISLVGEISNFAAPDQASLFHAER